ESSTEVGDVATTLNLLQLELDGANNKIFQQAVSARITDIDLINQMLTGTLAETDLINLGIDFSAASNTISALTDETQSLAESSEMLTAQFDNNVGQLTETRKALVNTMGVQVEDKKYLVAVVADESSERKAEIQRVDKVIVDETEARATAISQQNSSFNQTINSEINSVNETIANETEARATAISQQNSSFNQTINSEINSVNETIANETEARATAISQQNSSFNQTINSEISSVNQTIANETEARATAISQQNSSFNQTINSEISSVNETIANETEARATAINSLSSSVADNYATTEFVNETVADKASSSALTALTTRVETEEGKSASAVLVLNSQNDAINDLKAQVVLGTDINGSFSGIYINGTLTGSNISFMSNEVDFVNPDTGAIDLSYNASKNRLELRCDLIGAGGTFSGSLSAATGSFGSGNEVKINPAGIVVDSTSRTFAMSVKNGVYGYDSANSGIGVYGYANGLGGTGGWFEST
ncbi:unnamed protein product, partial [marine sediment metagenome]